MAAVREALESTEGVKKVDIDYPNKTATATVAEDFEDPDKLVAAVKAADGKFSDTAVK